MKPENIPIEKLFEYEDTSGHTVTLPLGRLQKIVSTIKRYEAIYPKEVPEITKLVLDNAIQEIIKVLQSVQNPETKAQANRVAEIISDRKSQIIKGSWEKFFQPNS